MDKHSLSISNFRETIELFLMIFLVAVTCIVGIVYIMPQYANEYTASLLDKVERVESIDESKIVLVGHSHWAFGLDSKMLEEAFGMPVVNMGLHGGLGNAFHENLAKFNVNEGDIIIVAHSSFYDDGSIGDEVLAWVTLENHWHLWKTVDIKWVGELIDGFPIYLKRIIQLWGNEKGNLIPASIYARTSFNEYGDIGVERSENKMDLEKAKEAIVMPAVRTETMERLNELNKYLCDRGAVMLIAAYPILDIPGRPDEEKYIEFQRLLQERSDAPVISDYVDYFFEPRYFYDTYLHLNDEGAAIRTKLLIEDMKRWDVEQKWISY